MKDFEWKVPEINDNIPQGDMPGDRISFHPDSVEKAISLFPLLFDRVNKRLKYQEKCVVSVYGGSGVGKTTIASLITYFFNDIGIGAYTLSGDNYPVRVPFLNDEMRMHCFETGGEQALIDYLGTPKEIEFELINNVIEKFHNNEELISLRRMGKKEDEVWYEDKDFSKVKVLIIEWTHGNSEYIRGVDIPVYLKSTPEETLEIRKARNRNANSGSPFINMVVGLEQQKIEKQAPRAAIILERSGNIIIQDEKNYFGPMLNAYPDSMGGKLKDIVDFLENEGKDVFSSFYILPSLYHSDLDRGFSVIDYNLEESLAQKKDLDKIQELGIDLKLDFVLNHASVNSPQFKDLLSKGEDSEYRDFFIDWNKFWSGYGEMTSEGYIAPDKQYIDKMHFRKPGLPILFVDFPDGTKHPYWNTFYQEVNVDDNTGKKTYLGQMDLNIKSQKVWDFYEEVLDKLSGYGAKIIRLDAFAYAPKEPGKKNFLNEPETWDLLEKLHVMADRRGIKLLPEIHARYEEKIYSIIAKKGYMVYDFFLPGLLITAIEKNNASLIYNWASEIINNKIETVNMLGCHDGIPLLDLKGLLPEETIQEIIDLIVSRGGYVKDLHGQKNLYYQVNATYYSALGEDDKKMIFARAIQLFMPGKPQIWYLDLLAGANDHEAVKRAGEAGHKEINRTNITRSQLKDNLKREVVNKQLELIRLRNTHPAFHQDAQITVEQKDNKLFIYWNYNSDIISLIADFGNYDYEIRL